MLTYLILNGAFMAVALLVLRRFLPAARCNWWLTLTALLALTAVFDNVIVGLGVVAYNPDTLLGFYVYKAPVEDFSYALLAVYIVPALWNRFDTRTHKPKEN